MDQKDQCGSTRIEFPLADDDKFRSARYGGFAKRPARAFAVQITRRSLVRVHQRTRKRNQPHDDPTRRLLLRAASPHS